ncbi:unnamed protein product [Arctogadus glacialis]
MGLAPPGSRMGLPLTSCCNGCGVGPSTSKSREHREGSGKVPGGSSGRGESVEWGSETVEEGVCEFRRRCGGGVGGVLRRSPAPFDQRRNRPISHPNWERYPPPANQRRAGCCRGRLALEAASPGWPKQMCHLLAVSDSGPQPHANSGPVLTWE